MKRTNPLFSEGEHPLDALNSVSSVLGFVKDIYLNSPLDLSYSPRGKEGFVVLLMMLEETTTQIYEELQKWEQKKPE